MAQKSIKMHPRDNIEVALMDLPRGEIINSTDKDFPLLRDIPAKHKFSLKDIGEEEDIIMYGVLVGKMKRSISKGDLISVENVRHASGEFGVGQRNVQWNKPDVSRWQNRTFMGYKRPDGSVGTANFWVIIPLVFCENVNVKLIQDAFAKELGYQNHNSAPQTLVKELVKKYRSGSSVKELLEEDSTKILSEGQRNEKIFPNVDGIRFLTHTMGCAGTQEDTIGLCGILAGYITHPNVAGATVLSLGCQNAQIELLQKEIFKRDPDFQKPLFCLEQQKIGNEAELINEAVKQTFAGLIEANNCSREPFPLSKLCIGMECGGSDGFSGISANPAFGQVSDIIAALGGSIILSEFPELCGVEQELSDRCIDEGTAKRFVDLMEAYQKKAKSIGSGFDSNPSAGNLRDGLVTDAIKSAGAAKKGGTSPITSVLDYPEKIKKPGLTLLCTPGSDIESTTAEVGAGANIVLFSTGLGTPTGNPITPVIKVSTNTPLFKKMNDIIDIDTGSIITGEETIHEVADRIMEHLIKTASGELQAKAMKSNHDDFIPWKRGISL